MQDNPGRDLWLRLGALEKCCTVKLETYYTSTDPITSVMRWRLTIARRGEPDGPIVMVEGDSALEALTRGLDSAEHVGWVPPADSN
jgi:hypothetical protein